ncbi:THO complex subunit 5A [Selaginella moellendorffii]|nr:THO complex subunit 5A [Selaginella moellendorffii]|eukprot:XP_002964386.2 THO complex subunit 5A [Selaginella moellendorffii]
MAYELLAQARGDVEDALARMLHAKKAGTARVELPELTTAASILLLNLRQINRVILQEEDRVKVETEAAKSPLDRTTLQLHNLLYEKNHYLKAIKTCKDFKSKYPDIELVPEEEFFRDAPEELQSDPAIKNDPHKLMLQRLNFEMHQRKQLCKQRELLEARKKMLQENIANRKKFLSSLPSQLKALKKASLPVQQHLGILHTKRLKQHQLADLLPSPLYILYVQLMSYKEAFGEPIDVEIIGSAKEAQAFLKQSTNRESGPGSFDEQHKADDEVLDDDDESQRRRKRTKRTHDVEAAADAGVLHAHPLSVILQIYDDDDRGGEKAAKLLTLKFEYLPRLNVVCAGVEGHQDSDVHLLANLFPDDAGVTLPNQAGKILAENKLVEDPKRTSRWYKWAQHLAGIDFLSETPQYLCHQETAEVIKTSISSGLAVYRQQHRVQTVLQQLRNRKKSQLALKGQLDSLEKLAIPPLKFKAVHWATHVPKCLLKRWTQASVVETLALESEAGREDGELPPAAISKPASSNEKGASSKKTARFEAPEAQLPAPRQDALQPRQIDLELSIFSSAEFADEEMEECEPDVPEGKDVDLSCSKQSWKDYGSRAFNAVLRRDDDASGRAFELEAQVTIAMDYPARPPLFQLRLLSGSTQCFHHPPSAGVVDVTEARIQGSDWFNELRAMEAKINCQVLEKLPEWEEDSVLAHQMALLAYLFDTEVDGELASSLRRMDSTTRLHRGRDRRIDLNL